MAPLFQFRLQHGDGGFHGFARHDELRQEHIAARKCVTHLADAHHVTSGDGLERIHPGLDGLSGEIGSDLKFPVDDALCHGLKQFFGHRSLLMNYVIC